MKIIHSVQEIDRSFLSFSEKLGEGQFGEIHLCHLSQVKSPTLIMIHKSLKNYNVKLMGAINQDKLVTQTYKLKLE